MNMTQLREFARSRGLNPGRLKKTELVRAIQQAENNPQCFNTGFSAECGQEQCLWREDCD